MIIFIKNNDDDLFFEINRMLIEKNIPLSLNKYIMDLSRPYKQIPEPKYKKGDVVYKPSNKYVALYIYEKPHWNDIYNSWRYNYDYGLTGSDGSAFESQLIKKDN